MLVQYSNSSFLDSTFKISTFRLTILQHILYCNPPVHQLLLKIYLLLSYEKISSLFSNWVIWDLDRLEGSWQMILSLPPEFESLHLSPGPTCPPPIWKPWYGTPCRWQLGHLWNRWQLKYVIYTVEQMTIMSSMEQVAMTRRSSMKQMSIRSSIKQMAIRSAIKQMAIRSSIKQMAIRSSIKQMAIR